jgi:hypothetical protein
MKTCIKTSVLLLILINTLSACTDRTVERITYTANVPVYKSFNEFRTSFRKSLPMEITIPGKIYFKDGYLFINEYGKGIHVIDNSDPANPEKIAFYEIMGNVDMAIKGNILYADSYIDLVAIDISDISNPQEAGRLMNVFPEVVPEGEAGYSYAMVDKTKGVIVGWEVRTVTEEHKPDELYPESWIYKGIFNFMPAAANADISWTGGAGTGGSMARFMLNNDILYVIAHPWMLKSVNTENSGNMIVADSINVPANMETLFKVNDKLFVGTTTGMLIYDLSIATQPRQISSYNHITACDPVVADGQYAYVTLRSGNLCGNGQNLLEVIDISSVTNPYLIKSYPMFNPYGLGIDGNLLFVCDGDAGLKIYDKTDPQAIITNQLAYYPGFHAFDVIPMNGILMLIGEDGIWQYDYSDPGNIVQISHITINATGK